jgi:hypothetical protein
MNEDVILCTACETENDALRKTCVNCGRSLIVVCPICNTINVITDEQCFACGQRFDMLGYIMARQEIRQSDRFTRQAVNALEILEAEKASHQALSDQLWEQERQRQAALIAQKREQQRQEKLLIIGATIVAVAMIAILMILITTR